MEMQCLHAWKKTIICHFENVKSVAFPGVSTSFCLQRFLPCYSIFFSCAHPEEKNKWCKCPCAWLNTSSFFLVHASAAGEMSYLCPPKYLLHFLKLNRDGGGGAFSPWKPLNGLRRIGSFSRHSSEVFQEFSGVLWSVKRGTQEAPRPHGDDAAIAIDDSTRLQERQLRVPGWDILSRLALISRGFRFVPRASQEEEFDK